MAFNENTRVKIPAILHLCRLGYTYLSLKELESDSSTNILTDIFTASILRINPSLEPSQTKRVFEDVSLLLENEDLG
jgi:type I restriction enzyme, R subunit